jgi:hypothetical protein
VEVRTSRGVSRVGANPRVYEDRHSKPELRWFWSITIYVNPKRDINTSGRAASLDEAKAQVRTVGSTCARWW